MMIRGVNRAPGYTMKQEATTSNIYTVNKIQLSCWKMALDIGFCQGLPTKHLSAQQVIRYYIIGRTGWSDAIELCPTSVV